MGHFRSVIVAAVALIAGGACLTPGAASAADPLIGAPAVGECRDYTAEDRMRWTDRSPVVDCAERHTGLVVAVAIAPDRFELSGEPNAQLLAYANDTCRPAWEKAAGANHAQQHQMAYTFSWFMPTRAQLAEGARWFRCDINIFKGKELGPLPNSPLPFIDGYLDRGDRKCLDAKYYKTSCANRHKWVSRGIVSAPKGRYSIERQDAAARRRCAGTLQRSDSRYIWIRVTKTAWKAGERHIVCFGNGR